MDTFESPLDLRPDDSDRARLLTLIRQVSLKRGRFVLASGAVSDTYLDLRLTTTHPEGIWLAARFVMQEAARLGADRIGGPTLGADPLVGAAMLLAHLAGRDCAGFMVRSKTKDHGTGKLIEGHLAPGNRVLVLDDVVTAGGSILRAIDAVREAGAEVVGSFCLVDRGQGGSPALAEAGAPLVSVFTLEEVLQEGGPSRPAPRRIPETPLLTVDAIVTNNDGEVLLVRRRNPPLGWSLPGGFVDRGESVEEAVARELKEETGLEATAVRQLRVWSDPKRDPRFHTASVAFRVEARGSVVAADDAAEARWFPAAQLPEDICFDHPAIIRDALAG